jgi:2-polyprenyl-3-methyl-5-hydroxy-6-metoxy-1,4-benzoquinol methylase
MARLRQSPYDNHDVSQKPRPRIEGSTTATLASATEPAREELPRHAVPAIAGGTLDAAWSALVDVVGDLLDGHEHLWVLEAGAGGSTLFDLPEHAYVVGVDRDRKAIERNIRLDERIVADLADYRPGATGFNLITCWYVLDGVADPAALLDRFAGWAAPDGLVVLAVPNVRSPRGLAAWLRGRTRLRRPAAPLTPAGLRRRFARHGFAPVFQAYYEDAGQASRRRDARMTDGRWGATQDVVRILSLGLLDVARTDYVVVFRRDRAAMSLAPDLPGS